MSRDVIDRIGGIIEVKRPDPVDPEQLEHCGMAVLISPRVAITCAHVVNAAMPRMLEAEAPPPADTRLILHFPMVPWPERHLCRVTKWSKMGLAPSDDIAILELEQPAPADAGTNVLAASKADRDESGLLSVFGVRSGRAFGEHVSARLLGKSSPAWRQIVADLGPGVSPGFSGGGVWDEAQQATIGVAVRRHDSDVAFFLPSEHLVQFASDIPYERRNLSSVFASAFTLFSAAFFMATLCHLLADRIRQFPRFLSLGLGNEILASFWGGHLIAVFLPLLLWMLLSFAKAYREHPWWMRMPQFGWLGARARPTTSRFAAVVTLVLLVACPLYVGGHFMRRLHSNEMKVYIDAKAFGYEPEWLKARGQTCGHRHSEGYCTHPSAGLYSLVPEAVPGKGGYFDNYYQIGGLDRSMPGSVSFFPIIQPVVLWLLMSSCLLFSTLLMWRVFKPARRLIDVPAPTD